MLYILASAAGNHLRTLRLVAGAVVVLAAAAGTAHAAPPVPGGEIPRFDLSSVLSAVTLILGGLLMRYDTVQRT